MGYTWTTGETITAAKLNSTGGAIIATVDTATDTLSMTVQEVLDAKMVYMQSGSMEVDGYVEYSPLSEVSYTEGMYYIYFRSGSIGFRANNLTDYPVYYNPPVVAQ